MPYAPGWSGAPIDWILLAFVVLGPFFFVSEAHGGFAFGYSKFADRQARFALPSRLGMFAIYFPAVLLYPLVHVLTDAPDTAWHLTCAALVSVHFGKRCAETLFVHRYSGVMNGLSVLMICGLYSLCSALLGWVASTMVSAELVESAAFRPMFALGGALWLLGTTINAAHHLILARLRAPGETEYRVPTAGLFRWTACPHYLGEIVAWLGYALIYTHIAAFVVTWTMTCYLAGRSHNTVKWYRGKGLAVPEGWKRLVPGVY